MTISEVSREALNIPRRGPAPTSQCRGAGRSGAVTSPSASEKILAAEVERTEVERTEVERTETDR